MKWRYHIQFTSETTGEHINVVSRWFDTKGEAMGTMADDVQSLDRSTARVDNYYIESDEHAG